MDDMDLPMPDVEIESVSSEELKEQIDAGEEVTLLDTRMESEYDEWSIGGETVESINIPYFEFLDDEIDDDVLAQIPDDREITVPLQRAARASTSPGR